MVRSARVTTNLNVIMCPAVDTPSRAIPSNKSSNAARAAMQPEHMQQVSPGVWFWDWDWDWDQHVRHPKEGSSTKQKVVPEQGIREVHGDKGE